MLTRRALGMVFTSRAVSPKNHRSFFLDKHADSDPLSVQKQEEFYYKLEQAKRADQS